MSQTPKVIEIPGIPMPLREASLDEYMSALPSDHLAQVQLRELRQLALDGAKATAELLEALKKIRALEEQLSYKNGSGKRHDVSPDFQAIQPDSQLTPSNESFWPDLPCPICHQSISSVPSRWKGHMAGAHHLSKDQIPPIPKHDKTPAQPTPTPATPA